MEGYSEAGKVAGVDFNAADNYDPTVYQLFSGAKINFEKGFTGTIKQTNSALKAVPGDDFKGGVKDWEYKSGVSGYTPSDDKSKGRSPAIGAGEDYTFLIPKDGSSVTLEIQPEDGTKTTIVLDFSKVSTKIVLSGDVDDTVVGHTGWTYTQTNTTLAFNGYDGREIFSAGAGLSITLTGENKISAYGVANSYEGSAIYAKNVLGITAAADGASLKVTQNTAGAYGIVSYSGETTIGSDDDDAKKVTLTVDGKPNRAIYAVKGLVVNNATIVAQSTEKTIRSSGAISIGVDATIDAKLVSVKGNNQGTDDYSAIKAAGDLSVGEKSIVRTQGLFLEDSGKIKTIKGQVIVSGDYTQNSGASPDKMAVAISGLYLNTADTTNKVIRAAPGDKDVGIFLINDAQAYNIQVVSSAASDAPVVEKSVSEIDDIKFEDKIDTIVFAPSSVVSSGKITVPEGKPFS